MSSSGALLSGATWPWILAPVGLVLGCACPQRRMDSRMAVRRSSQLAQVTQPLFQGAQLRVVVGVGHLLAVRAMNGTVAPPSSSSTAALTCLSRTPSSPAILRWTGMVAGSSGVAEAVAVTMGLYSPRVGARAAPAGALLLCLGRGRDHMVGLTGSRPREMAMARTPEEVFGHHVQALGPAIWTRSSPTTPRTRCSSRPRACCAARRDPDRVHQAALGRAERRLDPEDAIFEGDVLFLEWAATPAPRSRTTGSTRSCSPAG